MSTVQWALVVLFWVCAFAVAYAYIGYAGLIWCLAHWFGRQTEAPNDDPEALPSVSLLIAAYNEEAVIGQGLRIKMEDLGKIGKTNPWSN